MQLSLTVQRSLWGVAGCLSVVTPFAAQEAIAVESTNPIALDFNADLPRPEVQTSAREIERSATGQIRQRSDRPDQSATLNDSAQESETLERCILPLLNDPVFWGQENSLVAIAIGHAEGTRTVHGSRTDAYYGHTDPGNGVWNLGTFSYQHEAVDAADADCRQLARLWNHLHTLQQQANEHDLELSRSALLNGLDLATQAPRAALSTVGYIQLLREAYDMGLRGNDAILWARVYSFRDPETQDWDAPGLGNTLANIEADQARRMDAIAQVVLARNLDPNNDRDVITQLPESSSPFSDILEFPG